MPTLIRFPFAALAVPLLLQACAGSGVGYGIGYTTANFGKDTAAFGQSLDSNKEMIYATKFQKFRIVDTSGFLLAGLVNASRAQEARQDAIDSARRQGKTAGTIIKYEYEPMEALPAGSRVVFDLRLGFGAPTMTHGPLPTLESVYRSEQGAYLGIDVSGDIWGWQPEKIPLSFAVGFSALIDWFELEGAGPSREFSDLGADVYVSGRVGYEITNDVVVVASGHFGAMTPLLYAITGDENTPLFSLWSGVELAWRPIKHLTVSGELRLGRYLASTRAVTQTMVGLSALGTF